jgi:hypothetical protein
MPASASRIRQSSSRKLRRRSYCAALKVYWTLAAARPCLHRLRPFCRTLHGARSGNRNDRGGEGCAAKAGVALSLIPGRIEEFPTTQTYDVITIGCALHWLERDATLAALERILAPDFGRILTCRATTAEITETARLKFYREVRRAWTAGPEERRYGIDEKEWFAGSCF